MYLTVTRVGCYNIERLIYFESPAILRIWMESKTNPNRSVLERPRFKLTSVESVFLGKIIIQQVLQSFLEYLVVFLYEFCVVFFRLKITEIFSGNKEIIHF